MIFKRRGMTAGAQTKIDFDVNEAHILLLDDVAQHRAHDPRGDQ